MRTPSPHAPLQIKHCMSAYKELTNIYKYKNQVYMYILLDNLIYIYHKIIKLDKMLRHSYIPKYF